MSTKEKDDNGDHVPVSRLWETAISIAHCAWNSWTSLKSLWLNNPCLYLSPRSCFSFHFTFSLCSISLSLSLSRFSALSSEEEGKVTTATELTMQAQNAPPSLSRYCKTFPADLLLQLQPFFSDEMMANRVISCDTDFSFLSRREWIQKL